MGSFKEGGLWRLPFAVIITPINTRLLHALLHTLEELDVAVSKDRDLDLDRVPILSQTRGVNVIPLLWRDIHGIGLRNDSWLNK